MRRCLAAALLLWAGVGTVAAARAAGKPPVIPEAYRRASEALIGVLFPDARRNWTRGDLVFPDGRQQKMSLAGLTWAPRDGGWWVLAGVEFPDAFDEQVDLLTALKRPTERQAVKVVIAKADAEWRILEHRSFEPDPESPLSKLVSVAFVEFPTAAAADGWPRLRVRGVSGALIAGGAGLVWWDGEFDVRSMSWWSRTPSELWRKEGDGSEVRETVGAAAPAGAAPVGVAPLERTAGARTPASGSALSFACNPPCDVRPYAALEAAAARAKPSGVNVPR